MGYGVGKKDNEYARVVCDIEASKTVWMAIAVSLALKDTGQGRFDTAAEIVWDEWGTLHANGIVPQRPRKAKPRR